MNLILEPMLCFPIDQIGERKRQQQHQQAGGNDEGKQMAHVRLELGIVLRPRVFLYLDEGPHLDPDRIHQPLALTTALQPPERQSCPGCGATQ